MSTAELSVSDKLLEGKRKQRGSGGLSKGITIICKVPKVSTAELSVSDKLPWRKAESVKDVEAQ